MSTIKGKTTWFDTIKPNTADIEQIAKLHRFHPLILEELLRPSTRGRIEHYQTYLFMVYHVPVYDPKTKTSRRAEIDILTTKDSIVIVRYEQLEQLDAFINELGRNGQLQKEVLGGESYLALYRVIDETIKFSLRQLRHIEEQVHYVGGEIFSGHEEELLRNISYIKRNILDYRLIVRPNQLMFESLRQLGPALWGDKCRVYVDDIAADFTRVTQDLENYFQITESLEITNSQILTAAANATIQRFTVLAFLFTIPLFFVFLTDNHFGSSLIKSNGVFWTALMIIFAIVGGLAFVFKRKKML